MSESPMYFPTNVRPIYGPIEATRVKGVCIKPDDEIERGDHLMTLVTYTGAKILVTSPYNGIVLTIETEVGERVEMFGLLMTIDLQKDSRTLEVFLLNLKIPLASTKQFIDTVHR